MTKNNNEKKSKVSNRFYSNNVVLITHDFETI